MNERNTIKATPQEEPERSPPEAQRGQLYVTCTDDQQLMDELIAQSELTTSHPGDAPSASAPSMIGRSIGKYRVLELLGEGGMGAVYLAERIDDFSMKVAIKLMPGASARQMRRFVRERQILASLNHPGIARLYDGGTAEDGTPYIAMEYIAGQAITEYVVTQRLNLEARLSLFAKVCDAVAYAHRNLIVHRDIKPSNIFVTRNGEAKLLDFGIAGLVSSEDDEEEAAVVTVTTPMTPAYASPEQIRHDRLTPASDQYSLGMLLHELLTGKRPRFSDQPGARVTDRTTPTAPSAAVLKGQYGAKAAAPLQAKQLTARLRGDLDAIILKTLDMEPGERYVSVSDLAADIRRYLAHEPVQAQASSRAYLARKFVRRYRVETTATLLLIVGLMAAFGFSLHAWRTERRAVQEATAENEFLVDLMSAPDPSQGGANVRVVDVLDKAAKDVPEKFKDRPLVEASLLDALAVSYQALGKPEASVPLLNLAHDRYVTALGPNAPETFKVEYDQLVTRKTTESPETYLGQIVPFYERAHAHLPPDSALMLGIASNLGAAYQDMYQAGHKEYADAMITVYQNLVDQSVHTFGPDSTEAISAVDDLALADAMVGHLAEAQHLFEENLQRYKQADSYDKWITYTNLANIHHALGHNALALDMMQKGLAGKAKYLSADSPELLNDQIGVAKVLGELGRTDEARTMLDAVIRQTAHHAGSKGLHDAAVAAMGRLPQPAVAGNS